MGIREDKEELLWAENDKKNLGHFSFCFERLEELFSENQLEYEKRLKVALIIKNELYLPHETIISSFLYVLLNHKFIDETFCQEKFGPTIWNITKGLIKIQEANKGEPPTQTENYIKLILTLSDDIRSIFIALASHLNALRDINRYANSLHERIIKQGENLYIPIAHRLGLYKLNHYGLEIHRLNEKEK